MATYEDFLKNYVRLDPSATGKGYTLSKNWKPGKRYSSEVGSAKLRDLENKRQRSLALIKGGNISHYPLYRLSKGQYIRKRGNTKKGYKKGDAYRKRFPYYPTKLSTLLAGFGEERWRASKPEKTPWSINTKTGRPYKTYDINGTEFKKTVRIPGFEPIRSVKGFPGVVKKSMWRELRNRPTHIPRLLEIGSRRRERMKSGQARYHNLRKQSGLKGSAWKQRWNEIKAIQNMPMSQVSPIKYEENILSPAIGDLPLIKPLVMPAPLMQPARPIKQGMKRRMLSEEEELSEAEKVFLEALGEVMAKRMNQ